MEKLKETFNFDNIGEKIKGFAKWSCWISIILLWIAAAILFIVCLFDDSSIRYCWIPMLAAVLGPIGIWLSYWLLYAIGEMVSRQISVDCQLYYLRQELKNTAEEQAANSQAQKGGNTNSAAGKSNSDQLGDCEICGKENVYVRKFTYDDKYGKYTREMCADCINDLCAKAITDKLKNRRD